MLSTRKLMIRCGIGMLLQALVPARAEISVPAELPEDVEVLRSSYPMLLTVEAGEKSFLLDEELEIPGIGSGVKELVYFQLEPELADQKVLGSKAVFHGVGNLHVLYWNEDGRLCCHDFQIPFGQYLDLEGEYEEEAQIRNLLCVTELEVDVQEDGVLHLRCGMISQYTVQNRSVLDLVEDAYSPCRDVEMTYGELTLPAILDTVMYTVDLSARIPTQDGTAVDSGLRPSFPEITRHGDEVEIAQDGIFGLLTDNKGNLMEKSGKTSQKKVLAAHCSADTVAFSWQKGSVSCRQEGTDWRVDTQRVLDLSAIGTGSIPMVTSMKLGEERPPVPEQAAVIIRRKEKGQRLWDLAKQCGSTVRSIEKINALEGEPEDERLLLIPVL